MLLFLALITMMVGVLGAIAQTDIRRILSFHVIASIGFLLLGIALGSPLAMTAAVFYMVHAMLLQTQLFMTIGIIGREAGSFELDKLGGLYKRRPGLAMTFLLGALALIGIPPLSGFWAKVMMIETSLALGAVTVVTIVILYSLLTFVPLIRIWSSAFWSPMPTTGSESDLGVGVRQNEQRLLMIPAAGLAIVILAIGLMPELLLQIADGAATSLLEPGAYLQAVLGTSNDGVAALTEPAQ
ncbi:MAG: proton-conducting transporter membrane subunit [Pseudomonadota bacterium]